MIEFVNLLIGYYKSTKHDECEVAQLTQAFLDALPAFHPERLTLSLNVSKSLEEKSRSFSEDISGWFPQYLELIGLTRKEIGLYRAQLDLAEEG